MRPEVRGRVFTFNTPADGWRSSLPPTFHSPFSPSPCPLRQGFFLHFIRFNDAPFPTPLNPCESHDNPPPNGFVAPTLVFLTSVSSFLCHLCHCLNFRHQSEPRAPSSPSKPRSFSCYNSVCFTLSHNDVSPSALSSNAAGLYSSLSPPLPFFGKSLIS